MFVLIFQDDFELSGAVFFETILESLEVRKGIETITVDGVADRGEFSALVPVSKR